LRRGDALALTTRAGKTIIYRVTGSAVVHAAASGISTASAEPRLALVTCYPFDGLERGPWRYVVFTDASR
jgi:sortase A